MDVFVNQLIQFYSNNAIHESSPLNFGQYAVLPHNMAIVM